MSVLGNRCPKCGRGRADSGAACARCGLIFARWSKTEAPRDTGLGPEGEALWTDLQQRWGEQEQHDAFVKHCAKLGKLSAAGRCYREKIDADPKDALAMRMQTRIVGMATAALIPMRAANVPQSRGRWFLWVVAIGAIGGILAGLFFQAIAG